MSGTVICLGLYGDIAAADRALEAVKELGDGQHIDLHDAAVIVRRDDGTVDISERTKHHGAALGAIYGTAVGFFAVLAPPVGLAALAAGAAGGAVVGEVGSLLTRGLSEHEARELGSFLSKGEISLVVITDADSEATVLDVMDQAKEKVSRTSKVSKGSLEGALEAARASGEPGAPS